MNQGASAASTNAGASSEENAPSSFRGSWRLQNRRKPRVAPPLDQQLLPPLGPIEVGDDVSAGGEFLHLAGMVFVEPLLELAHAVRRPLLARPLARPALFGFFWG